jgi:hypothetical protein
VIKPGPSGDRCLVPVVKRQGRLEEESRDEGQRGNHSDGSVESKGGSVFNWKGIISGNGVRVLSSGISDGGGERSTIGVHWLAMASSARFKRNTYVRVEEALMVFCSISNTSDSARTPVRLEALSTIWTLKPGPGIQPLEGGLTVMLPWLPLTKASKTWS